MRPSLKSFNLNELKVIVRLIPLFKLYPKTIGVLVFVGIIEALSEGIGIGLFIPFFHSLEKGNFAFDSDSIFGRALIDLFENIPVEERLFTISACIFTLILVKGLLSYLSIHLSSRLSAELGHYLGCQAVERLLYMDINQLENRESGRFINLIENEVYATSEAVEILIYLAITLCIFPIFALVLFAISWQMALTILLALVGITIIIQLATKGLETLSQQAVTADSKFAHQILEICKGMYTIRLFGQEETAKKDFETVSYQSNQIGQSMERLSGSIGPVFEILIAITLLLVLYTFLHNGGSLPDAIVFLMVIFRLYPHVLTLNELRSEIVAAKASVDEVMAFLEAELFPSQPKFANEVYKGFRHSIEFKSVSHQYTASETFAVEDVSLKIKKGQTVAVIGRSGSGKSTIIKLLARFMDPTQGKILIDGKSIHNYQLQSWRNNLTVVGQHDYIFNRSVRENIVLDLSETEDLEVKQASKLAAADEFIAKLPQGYDTILGDQGVRLSSGQLQRIALARAIIRNPEIFVLDEATNALDSVSEHEIQSAFANIKRDRTVIVIAHRLSTIMDADHIIVMEAGRIVEQGSSKKLLAKKDMFARFHELQIQGLAER